MTKADLDKLSFALLSLYSSLYTKKYNKSPNLNKYKEKWGMKSLIEDYGTDTVEDILIYYFNKSSKDGNPLQWFYNNFDSLLDAKNNLDKDNKLRQERKSKMEAIRQEYINGYA